jgi:hypothetical protein
MVALSFVLVVSSEVFLHLFRSEVNDLHTTTGTFGIPMRSTRTRVPRVRGTTVV